MSAYYIVWNPIIEDEERGLKYEQSVFLERPEDAAEFYVEDFAKDNVIECAEYDLKVRDTYNDELFDVTVAVDWEPVFTASEARPAKDD